MTWNFGWTDWDDGLVYEDFFAGFRYEKENGEPSIEQDTDSGPWSAPISILHQNNDHMY